MHDDLVISRGVVIFSADDLPIEVREQIGASPGDHVVTRPRSRANSIIVDRSLVPLIESFRSEQTILEGIVKYSYETENDPVEVLETTYPLFKKLQRAGFLVVQGSEEASPITPSYEAGDDLFGLVIKRCLQVFEDVEVYQAFDSAGLPVVCKITRSQSSRESVQRLKLEAKILKSLDGKGSPKLLGLEALSGCALIIMEYIDGQAIGNYCHSFLSKDAYTAWTAISAVCSKVLHCYACFHGFGVLHGDIHERNVIISQDTSVRVVDFDSGRFLTAKPPNWGRSGVAYYYEPEYARAARSGTDLPVTSVQGEQYALAVLLFFLLCGRHYLPFLLDEDGMLRQIAESPPSPFQFQGRYSCPQVQKVLHKALSKNPEDRFDGLVAFAAAFDQAAAVTFELFKSEPRSKVPRLSPSKKLISEIDKSLGWDGQLVWEGIKDPPRASVNLGAAGVGYYFLRTASIHEDPARLEMAELWMGNAFRECTRADTKGAFYDGQDLTKLSTGTISLYHTISGIQLVGGLVAAARSNHYDLKRNCDGFSQTSIEYSRQYDLALGSAGILLGSSLLMKEDLITHNQIRSLALKALQRTVKELKRAGQQHFRGIAHGTAGLNYSLLAWAEATNQPLTPHVCDELNALAASAIRKNRIARWGLTMDPSDNRSWQGWCHGSAGYVFLWLLAHRLTNSGEFLQLAESAGEDCWQRRNLTNVTLCCGLAGQAYACLALFRSTGLNLWLSRAKTLSREAATIALSQDLVEHSLYRGKLGVALLCAELADPSSARMPLFEL